jgi:hypothetical protein
MNHYSASGPLRGGGFGSSGGGGGGAGGGGGDAAMQETPKKGGATPGSGKKLAAHEAAAELRIQERERRIFTATQLLGDTLAGTFIGHGIGWLSLLSSIGATGYGIYTMDGVTVERRSFLGMGKMACCLADYFQLAS